MPRSGFEVLLDLVLYELVWLDLVDDKYVNLDEAVKRMELFASELAELPSADQRRLVDRARELAEREPHPAVAESLRRLPADIGLVREDEPPGPASA